MLNAKNQQLFPIFVRIMKCYVNQNIPIHIKK